MNSYRSSNCRHLGWMKWVLKGLISSVFSYNLLAKYRHPAELGSTWQALFQKLRINELMIDHVFDLTLLEFFILEVRHSIPKEQSHQLDLLSLWGQGYDDQSWMRDQGWICQHDSSHSSDPPPNKIPISWRKPTSLYPYPKEKSSQALHSTIMFQDQNYSHCLGTKRTHNVISSMENLYWDSQHKH